MLTTIQSCELNGIDGLLVRVEVHVAKGHPGFEIIGLPDAAIKEASTRIYTALKNSGLEYPYSKKIIINLAPASLKKEGPSYDMAFVAGMLAAMYDFEYDFSKVLMVGELSLNGDFRHVRGIVSIVEFAKRLGCHFAFVPSEDVQEASIIEGIGIIPVNSILSLLNHLTGKTNIAQFVSVSKKISTQGVEYDFAFIKGQASVKRALEIAAAGMHNVLMSGSPGCGKTMLAQSLPSILPPMYESEMIEVTKLYSVSNLLPAGQNVVLNRPFRSPHHSSSSVSLIGGGRNPRPGEISLAHRGVLFLDELPEFSKMALEALRQPLEDGKVTISRALTSVSYPSRFMLVAAQNPCPCGYYSDNLRQCCCSPQAITRYRNKISGPLLDRIDLFIPVQRLEYDELQSTQAAESSSEIIQRVLRAHQIQKERLSDECLSFNSEMRQKHIIKYCQIDPESMLLLRNAMEKQNLSPRGYFRVLKLARTIADLENIQDIKLSHVAEALQYRVSEKP